MVLYEFYGEECPHCRDMESKVEKLRREEDIEIEQLEVWHDDENAEKMSEFDSDEDGKPLCGGVPFFYNTESGEWLCGEEDYEKLVRWARGEAVS